MPTVRVKLRTKFPRDKGPIFHRWLPDSPSDVVELEAGSLKVALSFPLETSWWASQPTRDELTKHVNVLTHWIQIEITAQDVPDDITKFMVPPPGNQAGQRTSVVEHGVGSLLKDMHAAAIYSINRLIGFVRSVKGQYWVEELELDHNNPEAFLRDSLAEVSIDGQPYAPLYLDNIYRLVTNESSGEEYINDDDWQKLKLTMMKKERPPLVGYLLATARELYSKGHRRSALLEAVVGLELALGDYARGSALQLPEDFETRVEAKGFKELVAKLGLRGSFAILLPMVIPERNLPREVVSNCVIAIEARNNVVHNGMRDVDSKHLGKWIDNIEKCCRIFASS